MAVTLGPGRTIMGDHRWHDSPNNFFAFSVNSLVLADNGKWHGISNHLGSNQLNIALFQ